MGAGKTFITFFFLLSIMGSQEPPQGRHWSCSLGPSLLSSPQAELLVLCRKRRNQMQQSQLSGLSSEKNHFLWPYLNFPLVQWQHKEVECPPFQAEQGEPEVLFAPQSVLDRPRESCLPMKEHKFSQRGQVHDKDQTMFSIRELIVVIGRADHSIPGCPDCQEI